MSPHCDDAVFACGDLIAAHPGTAVITVCTAGPRDRWLRAWDRDCGFHPGDDVMHVRRQEDAAALALLGARPIWLPFRDDQYGSDATSAEVGTAIARAVADASASVVVLPLGLFHRDHMLAHEAGLHARARRMDLAWLAYADALYRALPGDLVQARLDALQAAGIRATRLPTDPGPASPLKRRAIARYRSQLRGLATGGRPGHRDALRPETYWRLS